METKTLEKTLKETEVVVEKQSTVKAEHLTGYRGLSDIKRQFGYPILEEYLE